LPIERTGSTYNSRRRSLTQHWIPMKILLNYEHSSYIYIKFKIKKCAANNPNWNKSLQAYFIFINQRTWVPFNPKTRKLFSLLAFYDVYKQTSTRPVSNIAVKLVTIMIFVREIQRLNPAIITVGFRDFPESLQVNARIIKPTWNYATYITIHPSSIMLSFDAVKSKLLKAMLSLP
jgi:hypothetical protein